MEIAPPSSPQAWKLLHVPRNYSLLLLACEDIVLTVAMLQFSCVWWQTDNPHLLTKEIITAFIHNTSQLQSFLNKNGRLPKNTQTRKHFCCPDSF